MFTNVDLHTVQEYHDKVYGNTRKLTGDQELASFDFEKRDIAGLKRGGSACRSPKRLRRRRKMS